MLPKIDFETVDSLSQSDQIKILFNAVKALYEQIAVYEKDSFILSNQTLPELEKTVKNESEELKEKIDCFESNFDNFQVWIKDFLINTLEDRIKKNIDKRIKQSTIK